MKNLVFALTVFWAAGAAAALSIPTAETYEGGRKMCETSYQDIIAREKGFFVSVPVDYAKPTLGSTDIYAYFSGGYDAKKETVIYFTGGPGQPAHWPLFSREMPFNFLVMEQRGIGCSRPATLQQYLNPTFYSSENVARDAEQIRKYLKISRWSVYGISYGTVPATIYGSLFPGVTRAVILEGVVFSGDLSLWEGPHRRKILQKVIDSLPVFVVDRLEKISSEHGISDLWLSVIARGQLMYYRGAEQLRDKFLALSDDTQYTKLVNELKVLFTTTPSEGHPLFVPNEIPYYMISCQEFNMASEKLSMSDVLVNRKLVPSLDKSSPAICRQLKAQSTRSYFATNYPLQVPVTYFQGSTDSATPAPNAIAHFKQVAKKSAQLMILVDGGHNPNLQLLLEEETSQSSFFSSAVLGQKISADKVKKSNAQSEYFWAFTAR
ncbi:MAG TPA: alpha/beta hydrolase [Bdellovibrio sp.]